MFEKGDVLYDGRFGERYEVLTSAEETGGELVRIEDEVALGDL